MVTNLIRSVVVVAIAACSKKTPPAPTAGCLDLLACYRACPKMTADCTTTCDALGNAEARAANLALIACFGANNCQDESCLTANCGTQLQTCAGMVGAQPVAESVAIAPSASAGAVADKDYEFVGENGLTYTPELTIVAHGVQLGLAGTWRESKHNLTFEVGEATYTLRADGAIFGTGGITDVETGEWKLEAGALVLTPTAVERTATNGMHQENDAVTPDGPRTWSIEGVTLEWTTMGPVHEGRRADGLVVTGTPPSWAGGSWNWTLRRAK